MTMTSKFTDLASSSIFFNGAIFLLSSLVTGSILTSISLLVLELQQCLFNGSTRNRKCPHLNFEFYSISRDWGKLGILILAGMSLMKSYLLLKNAKFRAFTIPELLRKNQQGVVKIPSPPRYNNSKVS